MTANLFHQTNLLQIRDKDRNPAEGGHSSLGLTQNHPLAREQSSDFLRNQFVRGVCFHSPLSQAFKRQVQFSFGIQAKLRIAWSIHPSAVPRGRLLETRAEIGNDGGRLTRPTDRTLRILLTRRSLSSSPRSANPRRVAGFIILHAPGEVLHAAVQQQVGSRATHQLGQSNQDAMV